MADTAFLCKSDEPVYNGSVIVSANMLGSYERNMDGIIPMIGVEHLDIVNSGRIANHPRWYSGDTPN